MCRCSIDSSGYGRLRKLALLPLERVEPMLICGSQLLYLIIIVAIGGAAVPLISIIMIAAVYGLQALVFIIKREFMLVGWMVVYLLSYVSFLAS